jgi:hypothetical protein
MTVDAHQAYGNCIHLPAKPDIDADWGDDVNDVMLLLYSVQYIYKT